MKQHIHTYGTRPLVVSETTLEEIKLNNHALLRTPFVGLVRFTPEIAQYVLENLNTKNRPLSDMVVDKYAERMSLGQWQPDISSPICFSTEGVLQNGQHRLFAILEYGNDVVMNVSFGTDPAALLYFDDGRARTVDQNAGLMGVSNSRLLVSGLNMIGFLLTSRVSGRIKAEDVVRFTQENPATYEWANNYPKRDIVTQACVWGPLLLAYPTNPEKIIQFCDQLYTGENLAAGTPALVARNNLMNLHGKQLIGVRGDYSHRVCGLLLAHFQGRSLTRFLVNSEAIPYFMRKYPEGSMLHNLWKEGMELKAKEGTPASKRESAHLKALGIAHTTRVANQKAEAEKQIDAAIKVEHENSTEPKKPKRAPRVTKPTLIGLAVTQNDKNGDIGD